MAAGRGPVAHDRESLIDAGLGTLEVSELHEQHGDVDFKCARSEIYKAVQHGAVDATPIDSDPQILIVQAAGRGSIACDTFDDVDTGAGTVASDWSTSSCQDRFAPSSAPLKGPSKGNTDRPPRWQRQCAYKRAPLKGMRTGRLPKKQCAYAVGEKKSRGKLTNCFEDDSVCYPPRPPPEKDVPKPVCFAL